MNKSIKSTQSEKSRLLKYSLLASISLASIVAVPFEGIASSKANTLPSRNIQNTDTDKIAHTLPKEVKLSKGQKFTLTSNQQKAESVRKETAENEKKIANRDQKELEKRLTAINKFKANKRLNDEAKDYGEKLISDLHNLQASESNSIIKKVIVDKLQKVSREKDSSTNVVTFCKYINNNLKILTNNSNTISKLSKDLEEFKKTKKEVRDLETETKTKKNALESSENLEKDLKNLEKIFQQFVEKISTKKLSNEDNTQLKITHDALNEKITAANYEAEKILTRLSTNLSPENSLAGQNESGVSNKLTTNLQKNQTNTVEPTYENVPSKKNTDDPKGNKTPEDVKNAEKVNENQSTNLINGEANTESLGNFDDIKRDESNGLFDDNPTRNRPKPAGNITKQVKSNSSVRSQDDSYITIDDSQTVPSELSYENGDDKIKSHKEGSKKFEGLTSEFKRRLTNTDGNSFPLPSEIKSSSQNVKDEQGLGNIPATSVPEDLYASPLVKKDQQNFKKIAISNVARIKDENSLNNYSPKIIKNISQLNNLEDYKEVLKNVSNIKNPNLRKNLLENISSKNETKYNHLLEIHKQTTSTDVMVSEAEKSVVFEIEENKKRAKIISYYITLSKFDEEQNSHLFNKKSELERLKPELAALDLSVSRKQLEQPKEKPERLKSELAAPDLSVSHKQLEHAKENFEVNIQFPKTKYADNDILNIVKANVDKNKNDLNIISATWQQNTELKEDIQNKMNNELNNGKSLLIAYETGGEHWVSIKVDKNDLGINIIHQNPLGNPMTQETKEFLEKTFPEINNIEDKQQKQQENNYDCGAFVCSNFINWSNESDILSTEESKGKGQTLRNEHAEILYGLNINDDNQISQSNVENDADNAPSGDVPTTNVITPTPARRTIFTSISENSEPESDNDFASTQQTDDITEADDNYVKNLPFDQPLTTQQVDAETQTDAQNPVSAETQTDAQDQALNDMVTDDVALSNDFNDSVELNDQGYESDSDAIAENSIQKDLDNVITNIVTQVEQEKTIEQEKAVEKAKEKIAATAPTTNQQHKIVNAINSVLKTRLDPSDSMVAAAAAGDEESSIKRGLWTRGMYGINNQGRVGNINGYKGINKGATIGYDIAFEDNIMGIAYSNVNSSFKFKNNKNNDKEIINSHVVSIYGQKALPKNFVVQALVSASRNFIKNKTTYSLGDNNFRSNIKHRNHSYNAEGLLNYNYLIKNNIVITPNIGLRYGKSRDGVYNEVGYSVQEIALAMKENNIFSGTIGTKVKIPFKNISKLDNLALTLHGAMEHNFKEKTQVVNRVIQILDNKFVQNYVVPKQPKMSYDLGSSITGSIKNTTVSLEYNYHLNKHYQSHQGSIKLKVNL